jgi:TRAP-type C4-dicarboxylate transport system permease small subunit
MRLHQFALKCERLFDVVAALLLAVIVGCVGWQVFGRYVLGHSPSWTEELCGMLFVWMSMIGGAACLRSGHHLAIGALVDAVPARVRVAMLWVRDAAMLAAFVVLGIASYRFAAMNSDQESPSLDVPLTVHYSAVLVGTVLMAILLLISRRANGPIPVEPADDDAALL